MGHESLEEESRPIRIASHLYLQTASSKIDPTSPMTFAFILSVAKPLKSTMVEHLFTCCMSSILSVAYSVMLIINRMEHHSISL